MKNFNIWAFTEKSDFQRGDFKLKVFAFYIYFDISYFTIYYELFSIYYTIYFFSIFELVAGLVECVRKIGCNIFFYNVQRIYTYLINVQIHLAKLASHI